MPSYRMHFISAFALFVPLRGCSVKNLHEKGAPDCRSPCRRNGHPSDCLAADRGSASGDQDAEFDSAHAHRGVQVLDAVALDARDLEGLAVKVHFERRAAAVPFEFEGGRAVA